MSRQMPYQSLYEADILSRPPQRYFAKSEEVKKDNILAIKERTF